MELKEYALDELLPYEQPTKYIVEVLQTGKE